MSIRPDLFRALRETLSSDRLDAYRLRPSDAELDLLERYFWNVALSEALYPSLHALEVALRNNLCTSIAQLYGATDWLTQPSLVLHVTEQGRVADAVTRLQRNARPLTPGRIVAELNFGFWTSLLDSRYERRLWPRLLSDVFPNLPRRHRTRRTVSARMSDLRRLRNRVFHHEPIWNWPNLPQQHRDLLEATTWLDDAIANAIVLFDRFPSVHAGGSVPYRQQLDALHRRWP